MFVDVVCARVDVGVVVAQAVIATLHRIRDKTRMPPFSANALALSVGNYRRCG
jgi:hypothetical protein